MKQWERKICMAEELQMYLTCCYTALMHGLSLCFSLSYTLVSLPVVLSLARWPTQIHSASLSLPPPCLGDFLALPVVLPRLPWLEESLCLHLWLWRWPWQRQTGKCEHTWILDWKTYQRANDVLHNKLDNTPHITFGDLTVSTRKPV